MTDNEKKFPVLTICYNISTSVEELEKWQRNADAYLTKYGVTPKDPAWDILRSVNRGRIITWSGLTSLVRCILQELPEAERGHGPSDSNFQNPDGDVMPMFTSFYQKYVQERKLSWEERPCVEAELRAEFSGATITW